MKRRCGKCGSKLDVDDDVCQDCGARNPVPLPWYTHFLGALIVAVIALLLVDVGDVMRVLGFD